MKHLMDEGTKCLIVQSKFSPLGFWNYIEVCELVGAKYPAAPLGLLTVAALLPQQWDLKFVDANVEPLLDEHFEWADIVCTGAMLPQQQGAFSVIDTAHKKGRPVVVGGPDPTSQPELYRSADYLVLGEGEVTIPTFIQDLENGAGSGEYKPDGWADMTTAVVPRFDLIRFQDYIHVGIQFCRGCPYNCEFCDIIELYGRRPRTKTVEQIIKELQTLYGLGYRGHVDFVDDNFIGNKRQVKTVLAAIRKWSEAKDYPFYFSTEASINLADDEQLLQMMSNVDFRYVFVGIESPEDEILSLAGKKHNVNRSVVDAVKKIGSYGMAVNGGFIIGFDNETDRTADNMIRCIQDSGVSMAMLGMLYGAPNTQLTRRLEREGRLFQGGTVQTNAETEIDQLTSGLNFVTKRPRVDILKDFVRIIEHIYHPVHFYERVTYTALILNVGNKHRPSLSNRLRTVKAFLKLCAKAGFSKTTARPYWKMLFTVLVKNPRALEVAVSLAAMFIHFHKQSDFIIDFTNKEIASIERVGEASYNQLRLDAAPRPYVC